MIPVQFERERTDFTNHAPAKRKQKTEKEKLNRQSNASSSCGLLKLTFRKLCFFFSVFESFSLQFFEMAIEIQPEIKHRIRIFYVNGS